MNATVLIPRNVLRDRSWAYRVPRLTSLSRYQSGRYVPRERVHQPLMDQMFPSQGALMATSSTYSHLVERVQEASWSHTTAEERRRTLELLSR